MNMYPILTIRRRLLAYKFSLMRNHALNDGFQALRTGSKTTLDVFPGKALRYSPSLKLIGTKNIRVAEIVGTFERNTEFDDQFRPLQRRTLDRWINTYIECEQNGWSPILVHKVGDQYFVENGHYCVSVARFLCMEFIEAEVWEYALHTETAEICYDWPCRERSSAKTYAVE
jgi:hypothetical protein